MKEIEAILNEMTREEKVALVSGTDFMYTNPIPRLGIPSLCMSDGPHGLRKQTTGGDNGVSESEPATAFPTAAATASGWNPENLYRMGEAIGKECRYYGVHTLLGPGVNLKRNPLCGRNFEYFSEDPYLAGVLGAAEVNGVQSKGVGVSIKHFALNNAENYRFMGNSVASEKTARFYLRPFEYIVKHAHPATLMCAYNRINGTYCSENKWLLTDILREEWGFDGVVMTDWGAVRDRVMGVDAGLDLEMPGDTDICRKNLLDALQNGSLSMEKLDAACRNILNWIEQYVQPVDPTPVNWDAHHELAAEIASDCAVLLQNDGVLPLRKTDRVHIAGEMFSQMRYQGAGSSMIHPTRVTTPEDAFTAHDIQSAPVETCDKIVAFIGLTDESESEGGDREHMRLPEKQLALIESLIETGKPVIVVLFGGSPVELPFADRVSAILNLYLPGQNGGTAAYRLLYGEVNPSGKLAETWPLRYEDVPSHATFGKAIDEVYVEGIEIGYRYYNKHNIPVRYPFGHGLSYTTFAHTEWQKNGDAYEQTITNTGIVYGGEVAMLFLDGELRGFQKVYLQPGESVSVSIVPEPTDETVYDDVYTVPGKTPSLPITLESRFTDLKQTFLGRILFNAVLSVAHKQIREADSMPDGPEKDNKRKGGEFLKRILESNSIRSMSMSAGRSMPYHFAQGFVELANGHLLRGAKSFLSPVKVPPLPKDEPKDR